MNDFFLSVYHTESYYETGREKTSLQDFQPGPAQTAGFNYSYRRLLEAGNFRYRKKRGCSIRVAKTKALISYCAVDLRLCFHICKKQVYS